MDVVYAKLKRMTTINRELRTYQELSGHREHKMKAYQKEQAKNP
jgi:hypothetical protein